METKAAPADDVEVAQQDGHKRRLRGGFPRGRTRGLRRGVIQDEPLGLQLGCTVWVDRYLRQVGLVACIGFGGVIGSCGSVRRQGSCG